MRQKENTAEPPLFANEAEKDFLLFFVRHLVIARTFFVELMAVQENAFYASALLITSQ
jgi:hypothetical protein